jgi:hypothetical protein
MNRLNELSISGMINPLILKFQFNGAMDELVDGIVSDLVTDTHCAVREVVDQLEDYILDCIGDEVEKMNDQTYSEVGLLVKSMAKKLTKPAMVQIKEKYNESTK